jgi:hypothetical protein
MQLAFEGEELVDFRTVWLLLIVPAILLGLLSWPHIIRAVQEHGLEYPAWAGHGVVLSHFRRLVREEQNPGAASVPTLASDDLRSQCSWPTLDRIPAHGWASGRMTSNRDFHASALAA